MIKTKIKKALAVASITAMSAAWIAAGTLGTSFAAVNVGTGSVTGSSALDQAIVWDETFGNPGNASGSVNGIIVSANVAPTLNANFSTDEIALGLLSSDWTTSTGNLNIEVGTNAVDGVKITVRSTNGGLLHESNWELINDDNADGESYTFESTTADDSIAITGINKTGLAQVEVDTANKNTEHIVYETHKAEISENNDDVVLTVGATINATTSPGKYQDILNFTIAGNF